MTIETLLSRVSFDRDPISDTKIGETVYFSEKGTLQKLDIAQEAWNLPNLEHLKTTVQNELRDNASTANIREIAITHATLWLQELQLEHNKPLQEAQDLVQKEVERVAYLAQAVPEFKEIADHMHETMSFYSRSNSVPTPTIPGLTGVDGTEATREEFATDLLYVLLMDLRHRTGYGDIVSLNHDAISALYATDLLTAENAVRSLLQHAEAYTPSHAPAELLNVPDEQDNAYLILSRIGAKAYHGGPNTLKNNAEAMYWILTGLHKGKDIPKLRTEPEDKPTTEGVNEQRDIPTWIKRIAKLAVFGSGYYLWQQARDLNESIMQEANGGCVVSSMVGIEKVTFNIGTFLAAWHHVSQLLAKIDASRTYQELAKNTAFLPSAAILTAVGKVIASKAEI